MSISSRITSMEQHIGNAYDKLDELGVDLTNVDKNLNNIAELLDGVYEDYPKIEATDVTEPSINNTKAGKMEIDLKGNTEQTTYTGKNLVEINYFDDTLTINGVTLTNNHDGTVKLNGTFNANSDIWINLEEKNLNLPSSIALTNISNTLVSNTIDNYTLSARITNGNLKRISYNSSNYRTAILIEPNASFNNAILYVQIEQGSTATSFEPYTGGTASPNPDFPQNVKVVSGENIVKVVNKNLFDKNNTINNYWLLTDGTIEAHSGFVTSDFIKIKSNTNYYITNTRTRRLKYYDINKNALTSDWDLSTAGAQSFTTINNASYVRFCVDTDLVSVDTVQLEQGSTATTYEEHKEQDFPISLSSKNKADLSTFEIGYVGTMGQIWKQGINNGEKSSQYIKVKPNTTYTFTIVETQSQYDNWFGVGEYSNNDVNNFIQRITMTIATQNYFTFTTSNTTKYVRLSARNLESATKIQFNESSTPATLETYQPYYNYELCKIGEYKDYPWKDESTGKWYIKKLINKVVIKGLENWLYAGVSSVFYTTNIIDYAINNNIPFSNYYKGVTNVNGAGTMGTMPNNTIGFINQSGTAIPRLYIKDKRYIENSEDLETWLSTHNTDLYYVLVTPTDIEITDTTLINQLEAIYNTAKSYDDTTNIIQENNDLPFILDIKTLKKS